MKKEIEKKLHNEMKDNLKKLLVHYKDIVSYNSATQLFEEVIDELGFEIKQSHIPEVEIGLTGLARVYNDLIGNDFGYKVK